MREERKVVFSYYEMAACQKESLHIILDPHNMHKYRSAYAKVLPCLSRRSVSRTPHRLEVVNTNVLEGHTVSYVTDVEGNLDYWNRWVAMSSVVRVCTSNSSELELKEDCHVVYGGDVWDRGPGDLRVIGQLVSLKKKYPNRVHILLGNRDINKIRLITELSHDAVKNELQTYWTGSMMTSEAKKLLPVADRLRLVSTAVYN